MEVIKSIQYNWRFSQECGEEFTQYRLSETYKDYGKVIEIYDQRMNENCYYVIFDSGHKIYVFNPHEVIYFQEPKATT